ncbi:MAG: peptidoglycan-associated lipoprotein [Saprospiraceae bacterium]|jgi:peptidoglycan-associated lipoprotein
MTRYIYSTIFIFCFIGLSLQAQPIKKVKYEVMIQTADERIEEGDYYNALDWYRQAYNESKATDLAMSMAYSYYKLRDFKNAERWYTRILKDDEDNIFIDDRYAYGRTLRSLGEFDKAQEQYNKIRELSADQGLISLSELELTGMAKTPSFAQNEDVIVSFASDKINDGTGEYSPVQYDEKTLYFTSFQSRKETVLDGSEKDYESKVYFTEMSTEGFGKPKALGIKVNREDYHQGNLSFSQDKRTMYFTRQVIENDDVISSTVYKSKLTDEDEWSYATPVDGINGDFISTQPSPGELFGQEVLFFVSDADGGSGGLDIYYSLIRGESMGQPVNLGPIINTSGDDITPSYHDGQLYFSTESRPGLGGYDIFTSSWDGSRWSLPENMGNNYNGLFDDYYLSFNEKGSRGYLVSNRPDPKKKKLKSETCCYDIYNFAIKELNIDLLVGVGTMDEKPLNGATVEVSDQTIYDEPKSQTLPEEFRFDFDLFPERKYQVITSKEGYISDTLEFNTSGIIEDETIRKKVLLREIPPVDEDPGFTTETVTINEAIRFDNIYYDFDKWDILPESETDLNIILNLMNEYGDMVIELSSHTDSRGQTAYNQNLSQKRAESARQWLLDKGVVGSRIVPKGYGEAVILNKCVNGARCTNEEHRFNRRTEFKILEGPQTIEIRREVKKDNPGGK